MKVCAFLPSHGRIALFSRTLLGSSIWRSTEYLLRWQVMGVPRPFGRWGDTLLADSERERRERGSVGSDDPEEERSWSETFDAITRLHWEPYQWTSCSDDKFRRTPANLECLADGLWDRVPEPVGTAHRSLLAALGNAILPQVAFPILWAIRQHVR
jgi:hypothetical protein